MRCTCLLLPAFLLFLSLPLAAQEKESIRYTISFPNAVHHEAEVQLMAAGLGTEPFTVRMARSSPGRYALHEFAKNVYNVRAVNSQGQPLELTHPNPHEWTVNRHDGTVTFRYTLFADRADGTYSQVDLTHAHLNIPATFAYAPAFPKRPIQVRFELPQGSDWKIATQLPQQPDGTYRAPDLQYFMDSPVEISNFTEQGWQAGEGAEAEKIRLTVHHTGTEQEVAQYAEQAKKIVQEAQAVFGELPRFDYGQYTFLACYMPQSSGDGMEHRNSTIMTGNATLKSAAKNLAGTMAHEFFHAWNVERLRPASLEPFRFDEANMSGELWFAEGFTQYYGELITQRAGIQSQEDYFQDLASSLNSYLLLPGPKRFSPVQMSQQAPFVDAARSIDPVNRLNTYLSYYTYGAVLGLYLDLKLRALPKPHTLDEYMQAMWRSYGKSEKPYQLNDLERTLIQLTGDEAFASTFFINHIHGHEPLDFAPLLMRAGLQLRPKQSGKGTLGLASFREAEGGLVLSNTTLSGSPLFQAGVDQGDVLLAVDGKKVSSAKTLEKALTKKKPGQQVQLTVKQRNGQQTLTATLAEDPELELVPIEKTGQPLTQEQEQFRRNWLAPRRKMQP